MTKFIGLRVTTYSCLIDDSSGDRKTKCTKKCVIKRKVRIKNYKNRLKATQIEIK